MIDFLTSTLTSLLSALPKPSSKLKIGYIIVKVDTYILYLMLLLPKVWAHNMQKCGEDGSDKSESTCKQLKSFKLQWRSSG